MDRKQFIAQGIESLLAQVTEDNQDQILKRGLSDILQNSYNKDIVERKLDGYFPDPANLDLDGILSSSRGSGKALLVEKVINAGLLDEQAAKKLSAEDLQRLISAANL